jgi:hypothetical protein
VNQAGHRHSGSFRDPAGFVFSDKQILYRQVNQAGKADFDYFLKSGFYKKLIDSRLLVPHSEIKKTEVFPADSKRYKVIKPELIPFNSYPYEWTFSQLKAAALLTLELQKLALAHGMILKDASAYNVQFIGHRAIFIDTLSFRIHKPGDPWDGYKQFCEHFIAPLALATYTSLDVLRLQRDYLDGIPLQIAAKLLPSKVRFRRGLLTHLYLHASSLKKFEAESSKKPKARRLSSLALNGIIASLERTINHLKLPARKSQWSAYYENTNYSGAAFADKQKLVDSLFKTISPQPALAWDVGANDGTFSEVVAHHGAYTVAFDVDPQTIEQNYHKLAQSDLSLRILPLVQDLTNPSPPIGWNLTERASLIERGPADVVLALALVHHLAIGNNLPLADIADFFSKVCRHLIIEFVPKQDSKVQFLLRSRNNIFTDYDQHHFEQAFGQYFELIKSQPIRDSQRIMYLYKTKA